MLFQLANHSVERDSHQAALVGSLRATRSGSPSRPRQSKQEMYSSTKLFHIAVLYSIDYI